MYAYFKKNKYNLCKFLFYFLISLSILKVSHSYASEFVEFKYDKKEENISGLKFKLNFKEIIEKEYLIKLLNNKEARITKNLKRNERIYVINEDTDKLMKLYPNKKDSINYNFIDKQNLVSKKIYEYKNSIADIQKYKNSLLKLKDDEFYRLNIIINYNSKASNKTTNHEYGFLCPIASNKKNEHVVELLNSNTLIFEDHEDPANNRFLNKYNRYFCDFYLN